MFLCMAGTILFGMLYAPVLSEAVAIWSSNPSYSHGFFIYPCCLFVLWLQRREIKQAVPSPTLWGLLPLLLGLAMQSASYMIQVQYVGMWSLVPTVAGAILLLHGVKLWRICQFPVLYTLFAAPFSNILLGHIINPMQECATAGAVWVMSTIGWAIVSHGNVIEVPGAALEVATACSGFHGFVSILAVATLYGYLFTAVRWKRMLLMAAALPMAMSANILRLCILIVAATYGGINGYHAFHDPAAYAEVFMDFAFLILLGKMLGCNNIRFTL